MIGLAIVVAVFEDGIGQRGIGRRVGRDGAVARIEKERAFLAIPSVVLARFDEIDFLDVVLANVADDQAPGRGVEGEAKRIAQAVGINFVQGGAAADERIARRARDNVRWR